MQTPVRFFGALAVALAVFVAPLGAPSWAQAAMPDSFADLAEKVSPAVVDIKTESGIAKPLGEKGQGQPSSPFDDFFKDFNGDGPPIQRSEGLGAGFVISADGYIVTNNHVIDGADTIEVEFFSGDKRPATVVGRDLATDVAVLKVEAPDPLPFVTFGDSDKMRVGDWVVAVGNPLGQGFSVSAGIISARKRELNGVYDDFLQTDAAINKGNSGGPLFNTEGQVIGMNTAILSPTGTSIGIGFAMASNVVSGVADQLRQHGEMQRGWLGARIQSVTPALADKLGLPAPGGAMVVDVPDGPARDAGLRPGDVILRFDGAELKDASDLTRRVGRAPAGSKVTLTLRRDGAEKTLDVTLGQRETGLPEAEQPKAAADQPDPQTAPQPDPAAAQPAPDSMILGMALEPLTDELRGEFNLPDDVNGLAVTDVAADSAAYDKGIRAGDLLTEAGQEKLATVDDLTRVLDKAREGGRSSILILLRSSIMPRFVSLPVE